VCGDDVAIVKEERPMVRSMQRNTGDVLHVATTIRRTQDYIRNIWEWRPREEFWSPLCLNFCSFLKEMLVHQKDDVM
jgi:hypothetical protein